MSAGDSGREARSGRGPGDIRAGRMVAAILFLVLLLVVAIGVSRRFHAGPAGGQTPVAKAPPPPGNRNARERDLPRPKTGDRRSADPGRVAQSTPLVLGEGEVRMFIAGTVSLPVAVGETGPRFIVESTGEGFAAEVMIAAAPDGTASLSVRSGTVDVAAFGRRVRVGPGTFTTVAAGVPPALPETLPPPDQGESPDGS